jgi:predicted Holliday junction resolvase-like endonuclease
MDQYLIVAVAILATVCIGQFIRSRELKKSSSSVTGLRVENEHLTGITKEFQSDIINLQEDLGQEREKNRTLLSQKKSSETRLGQISEHLIPFLDGCNHDPKSLHFMGNPIDYISFDFDEGKIVLIEVKSGNSKPSKRQKIVKNIIKTGRVFYEEIRINEKGVKSKVVGLEDKVAKS